MHTIPECTHPLQRCHEKYTALWKQNGGTRRLSCRGRFHLFQYRNRQDLHHWRFSQKHARFSFFQCRKQRCSCRSRILRGPAISRSGTALLIPLRCPGDRRGPARPHGADAENRDFSSVFEPSGIAEAFSESKCLCLNFEVRVVRSIETPVSKIFRPRGFFMRDPRHPAKTRDVTPVFSATYAHTAAAGVSLPPTPQVEKTDADAEPGARNSRKSRPHQRHPGSGLYGASGSLERFPMAEMDLRVMGGRRLLPSLWRGICWESVTAEQH